MRIAERTSWSKVDITHLDNQQAVSRQLSAISKQGIDHLLAAG
jgi:hypothetical protein